MRSQVLQLARTYGLRPNTVYTSIYCLMTERSLDFRKKGGMYYFTPEQLQLIEEDLNKRGHYRLDTKE